MSRYILKMSLLLPPRDGSKWSKNYTLPLVQSVPNLYQGRTIVMTSETSKKLFFFSSPQRLARHRRCYEADGFRYLDCADGRSGRLHTSYYAAINEQPPKKKVANGPHTDEHAHAQINTNAKTDTHGWKVTVYSVYIRERYSKGTCCLLLRSAHKRRHPYTRCYISLKESGANAPHVDLFFFSINPHHFQRKKQLHSCPRTSLSGLRASVPVVSLSFFIGMHGRKASA